MVHSWLLVVKLQSMCTRRILPLRALPGFLSQRYLWLMDCHLLVYALSLCHVIAHKTNSEGCIQILHCYDLSNFKRLAHNIEETNVQVGILAPVNCSACQEAVYAR